MMISQRYLGPLSDLMLLAVAVVWGSSYGVAKSALSVYPVLALLILRFGMSFLLLSPSLRHLWHVGRDALRGVLGSGLVLLAIFLCETYGVLFTQAANAAFLISLCVVLTPLAEWAILKRTPTKSEWFAVFMSIVGVGLLFANKVSHFGLGDGLILLAALLRAINMCVTKRVMRQVALPALTVTAVQSGVVVLGCTVVAALFVPAALPFSHWPWEQPTAFGAVVYLVLVCTLFAFFAQNFAIGRRSPTRVALLMGSEPAFGACFASLWLGERIGVLGWIGGGVIVSASLLCVVNLPALIATTRAAASYRLRRG